MEKLRKTIYFILSVVAILTAVVSILSMLRNTESRWLKMLDFPRIQFFITSVVSLVLFVLLTKRYRWYDYLLVVSLIVGLGVNGSYLVNYTPLVEQYVPVANGNYAAADEISILLSNVKMSNRESRPLLELIGEKKPDLLLVMEVDEWWDEQLKPVESTYPHVKKQINEVAYGMSLYSKFTFEEVNVNYLNNKKVPSIECIIRLENGRLLKFYGLHPVPPTHFADLPDNEGQEEVAMKKLGRLVADRTHPSVVAGDFNDVVWSYTDELTGTEGVLRDVRVGRGFYNSFDADNFLLRWPLDHVFVTEEFQLTELERMPTIGSDHFPIYVKLVLKESDPVD